MESIRATQKKYGSRAMFAAIVIAMILIVIGEKAAGKGLVLGALFSVINFVLMGQSIYRFAGHSQRTSTFRALFSIAMRYVILAMPLIAAIKFEQLSIVTVIIGLFAIQVMILLDQINPVTHKSTSSS